MVWKRILRSGEGKKLRALTDLVPEINSLEPEIQQLSDDALAHKTVEFREKLANGADLNDILLESFAVAREAGVRLIGQRAYDVQLMGGACLHLGWVAEMKTGEGKTLTSLLPTYLNGLSGKGVHQVTVNDYLAARDSEWMGQIHNFLGLEVGLIIPGNNDHAFKKRQYAADITYGTNNEFGFDYLRDNMAMSREAQVQRGHNFCIVDEIDSILIDEARTPLIISGRVADAAQLYYKFASIVRGLSRDLHYEVDEEKRTVSPTEEGIYAVERALDIDNLYDSVRGNYVHQFGVALRAKELFHRDKEYIVASGEVKIVDDFTGRVLEGRRWSDGLHQAVEAKEGVKIKDENQTLATITLQNYFRMYDKLAGMTGTAQTEAAELHATYELDVVQIPTNLPLIRADEVDLVFKTEDAKYDAVADDIAARHKEGQPVLVGTISVEKSEKISQLLNRRNIPHEILNAKQHTREAEIVTQAGKLHSVTVATNMAGRGVDILLGGNPEGMAARDARAEGIDPESPEGEARIEQLAPKYKVETDAEGEVVRELGGLYVVATERHDSRRIDNQLRGRAGRQGDPGESRFYLSLEDDLMRIFASGAMDWVMGRALPEDVPIDSKMVTKAVERAQTTVEQKNAEVRKNVLKYDDVMNEQRKVIYTRRNQILDGEDLRDDTLERLAEAVDSTIGGFCPTNEPAEWDLDGLMAEIDLMWDNELDAEDLADCADTDGIYDRLMADGTAAYEAREEEIGADAMREVERQVMLRILDTKWREHLYDMDHLREGIHLRAMGQKDPLVEYQREGFEAFSNMLDAAARDFVTYVMHVQVEAVTEEAAPQAEMTTSGPDGSPANTAASARQNGAVRQAGVQAAEGTGLERVEANATGKVQTVVRAEHERTPRNAPCPCGSGKKYKNCIGKPGCNLPA
ncbi:MAG: preprotein translocase subunit SecA [Actinomycetota bacterium]